MVALVVVADARVRADHRGGLVDAVGVDLRGDERRAVAERPGVEDRRQLAQHAELLHLGDPRAHLGFGDAEALAERRERPRLEGEVPLHRVEQLAVELFELVVASSVVVMRSSSRGPARGRAIQPHRGASARRMRRRAPAARAVSVTVHVARLVAPAVRDRRAGPRAAAPRTAATRSATSALGEPSAGTRVTTSPAPSSAVGGRAARRRPP